MRSGHHAARSSSPAAAAELGVADTAYLRTEITGRLGGQPWTGPIPYDAAEHLTRLLQAAAWVTVAYLSGMRDSEVKHLRRGCLSVSRAEDGRIYRRRLTSLAFKGEDDPAGVIATWIVGEPVERAIQVLERLQAGRDTYLFARIPGSRHDLRSHATGAKSTEQTNDDLAAFTDWVNAFCQQHGRPDGIPLVNGRAMAAVHPAIPQEPRLVHRPSARWCHRRIDCLPSPPRPDVRRLCRHVSLRVPRRSRSRRCHRPRRAAG